MANGTGADDPSATGDRCTLRDASDEILRRFYALLEVAFSPDELIGFDELDAVRHLDGLDGTVILDGDDVVAGMVTETYLGGRLVLLAYLVVTEAARSTGLGSQLLRELVAHDGEGDPPLIVAEIEDPRFFETHASRGDPAARARFYDRSNGKLLPLPYAQPALHADSSRVRNMLLITIGWSESAVDGRLIADFLEEYYRECEGDTVVATDPEYLALRDAARSGTDGALLLHPLADLDVARPATVG